MRNEKVYSGFATIFYGTRICAHPGTGIVIDSKGNIFYTDLAQVWKRQPNGQLTVAVPSVHTHELPIDCDDSQQIISINCSDKVGLCKKVPGMDCGRISSHFADHSWNLETGQDHPLR